MSVFRRRRPIDSSVERALRASLAAQARQAPSGAGLPERILAAVDSPQPEPLEPPLEPPRRWVGWALPAVAAAAAVAAVAVGISVIGNSGNPGAPAADRDHSHRFGGNLHSSTFAVPTHVITPPSTPTTTATETAGLRQVRIIDLTFVGSNDGWALATAACPTGRCTELLRTHDGTHWSRLAAPSFRFPAVAHIRFANDGIGYAFGPSAFYVTNDGGRTWQRQPGGALALETFNGNVIRVTSPQSGCPGPCNVSTEVVPIGSTAWTSVPLTAGQDRGTGIAAVGVYLSRGGDDAYVLATQNPAGGAQNETSTLFRSTNNGGAWSRRSEPCPQRGGEVDSTAVAAGAQGDVAVLCVARSGTGRAFVAVSRDAGARFASAGVPLPVRYPTLLAGDARTVLAAAGPSGLAVSRDGGATWQLAPDVPGGITFVGFENSQVGRVVAQHGRSIWTTRDGGRSWTPVTFR